MKTLSFLFAVFLLLQFNSFAQQGWFLQNPYPTTSNLNSVDFINELIAIAVGSEGTILKTINGGESWMIQTSGTTNQLNDVCFVDMDLGFIVGNEGTFLKTTDGGITWMALSSTTTNDLFGVSFSNALTGTIVGSEGIILRTNNGGENWEQQISGTANNLNSVCLADDSIGTTVGDGGIILRTTSGGITWTQQTSGITRNLCDVCFIDSLIGYTGGDDYFLKTTDGGLNWEQLSSLNSYPFDECYISFNDSDNGYVALWYGWGNDTWLLKTTDGGTNWTLKSGCDCGAHILSVSFADSNNGIVVGDYGMILRTSDGFETWNSNYFTRRDLMAISFIDSLNGIVVGGEYYGLGVPEEILKTTDGGITWTKLLIDSLLHPYLTGVCYIEPSVCTMINSWGVIYRTTDGFTTWAYQQPISGYWGHWDIDFIDVNIGWAAGGGGLILRTSDGGTNWTEQVSGTTNSLNSVCFTNDSTGTIVGNNGIVLRTTNGGENWGLQSSGSNANLLDVIFTDRNNGTVVGDGGTILRTKNGGDVWSTQVSGTAMELSGVSFTDSLNGTVVGGGYLNNGIILRTTDGGETWIEQSGVATKWLYDVYYVNSSVGWAVGGTGTILKTTNGGVTPVELISFNGSMRGNMVNLSWKTATETNNHGFEIQRSINKTEWITIGFREGNGTITEGHNYSYIDKVVSLNSNKIYYRLKQVDFNGSYNYSRILEIKIAPVEFELLQNYPNPFNPTTKISYSIPHSSQVVIKIFNILGKEIETLINEEKPSGTYEIKWNAANLPSGVYFYRIQAENFVKTKKMLLLK